MTLAYTAATPTAGAIFCELKTDAPTPTYLVLANGTTATGYEILEGLEFGMPTVKHQYSGLRGMLGARPAHGTIENRAMTLPLYVQGTSKDNLASLMSDLALVTDELRRFGGRVNFRLKSQTYPQSAVVLATDGIELTEWGVPEARSAAMPKLELVVAPYLEGAPFDITDDFTTDTLTAGHYTVDAGAADLNAPA